MPYQNASLWHIDYSDDFCETADAGEALKTKQTLPFVRDIYMYKENFNL